MKSTELSLAPRFYTNYVLFQQLGKPLRAQARTQLNVAMSRVDGIHAARGLRDIIFPMLWWADGIDGIEDEKTLALLRDDYRSAHLTTNKLTLFLLQS